VVVTPSAVPAVFAVQKPHSIYGSMGFGGAAVGGRGLPLPPPNYVNDVNPAPLGPNATIPFTSLPISRQASGVVYVDGSMSGTQTVQSTVTLTLYRDYGLPGQVQLIQQSLTPGGVGPASNWGGDLTLIDALPDSLPHTYTVVATASGGSFLSVPAGSTDFQAFEMGPPS
jgi:hypothetical protein